MLKKTFILIPIIMMFTACSDKNLALNEPTNSQVTSTVNSKLSYNEYKRMTEEKNKKTKLNLLQISKQLQHLLSTKVKTL